MSTGKRILLSLLYVVIAMIGFFGWYQWRYSMDVIEPFEVNDPAMTERILIATQGSEFKDAVVKNVVDHYRDSTVYIKVIDDTHLREEDLDDWNAILILHTWEKWRPQPGAEAFLKREKDHSKIFTISTSGSGDEKMKNVDAITSASNLETVPTISTQAIQWLDKMLTN